MFSTDPAHGFTVGTPDRGGLSWHGIVHAVGPVLVLAALVCLVTARTYVIERRRAWMIMSLLIGLLMFLPDAYPGTGRPGYTLALATTGTLGFLWCSAIASDRLRRHQLTGDSVTTHHQ